MKKVSLPRGYKDIELLQSRLHLDSEEKIKRRADTRVIQLFHNMAENVPAYKDFLKSKNFSPNQVKNISDFSKIPPIDKDNYLRKYPKNMLCWNGDFTHGQWVISTTSGSSGVPYYFPRQQIQDWQYAISAELYLRNNFQIQDKSTLYIIGFPMGAWIGGVFTYEALKLLAQNGDYDLSIITPGIHKQEIINAIKQLGSSFDQIIIGVYAPFLKDIIDDGESQGIDWKKLNIGFVFSAEAFTENLRDYIVNKVGIKDVLSSTLNHYGTVDLGTMAHETPESILIRRELIKQNKLGKVLLEDKRQPTLCQYDPNLFYFDSADNNIFCSAYSGIPLVRYNLKDYGGVVSRKTLHNKLQENGIDIEQLLSANKISDSTWNLPYVYVYERNDFSVSYFAAQVYPDTVRRAIETSDSYENVTGKFTMLVDYDTKGRQQLYVHVEMKPGIKDTPGLENSLKQAIHSGLLKESSEYLNTHRTLGDVFGAKVKLWDYDNPLYFKSGGKQKWVKK